MRHLTVLTALVIGCISCDTIVSFNYKNANQGNQGKQESQNTSPASSENNSNPSTILGNYSLDNKPTTENAPEPKPSQSQSEISQSELQPVPTSLPLPTNIPVPSVPLVPVAVEANLNAVGHLAGSPGGIGSNDGLATQSRFNGPDSATVLGDFLYISDKLNHLIRRISLSTGMATIYAGITGKPGALDGPAKSAQFNFPSGITNDGQNLYIVDSQNNTIRKINTETEVVTTIAGQATIRGSADGISTASLFKDPNGIVYLASLPKGGPSLFVSDTGNATLRKIDLSTLEVTTAAGTAGVSAISDGLATKALFSYPYSLATDGTKIYISENTKNIIRQFDLTTLNVGYLAGSQIQSGSADGPSGTSATFFAPSGLASDTKYLYVTEVGNHIIRRIEINGAHAVTTIAGSAKLGSGYADGATSSAQFSYPRGITHDKGVLYVAEDYNHTIRSISLQSNTVVTLGGLPGMSGFVDEKADRARFSYPTSITATDNSLYVTDQGNHAIRKINLESLKVDTVAGSPFAAESKNGTGSEAHFKQPLGIASDQKFLYVTELESNHIRSIEISTGKVVTLTGTAVSGSLDGSLETATFNRPSHLFCLKALLFVSDSLNSTIRLIDLTTSTVSTFAGSPGETGAEDGMGEKARFNRPGALTSDGKNLFVLDTLNRTIRKIDIETREVSTLAGSPKNASLVDGRASDAGFVSFGALSTDSTNLYVTDPEQNVMRKVDIRTGNVTTVVGANGEYGSIDGIGSQARFTGPNGIVYLNGTLYVADTFNNKIRKIEASD